jgi:hypothetical protein
MVDINTVFSGDTLKASDLGGKDHVVTIESVETKEFDDGVKLLVRFVDRQKVLIANKTNSKRIALIARSPNTDAWPGVAITLRSEIVDFREPTPAIRVQAPSQIGAAPARPKPVQPSGGDRRPEPPPIEDDDLPW